MHPILIDVAGFQLHTYAVMMAVGFIAAIQLGNYLVEKHGIDLEKVLNMEVLLIVAGLAGSRLMFVAITWSHFRNNLLEIPLFWKGGLVYYGGFLLALISCLVYTRVVGLPMLRCSDIAAPCVVTGQFFGRVGCLFAGCCYGAVCDLPWAIAFPVASGGDGHLRHPTQAYEMLALLLIFAILMWYYRRPGRPEGTVMVVYGYLYAVARFVIELWRDDDRGGIFLGRFSISQAVSLAVIAVAILAHVALILTRRSRETGPPA